jgi:SAM-dependent methyltransferase
MGISGEEYRTPAPTRAVLERGSGRNGNANEPDIEGTRGDKWQRWTPSERERFIDAAVVHWRQKGFPYYSLTNQQVESEIGHLRGYDPCRTLRGQEILANNLGLRLVNAFHPQMWHVRCTRYHSPYETFCDNRALGKAIRKALQIWPDRYGANGSSLRRMLKSFSNTVAVSNFRPTAAMGILHLYSPLGGRVLDFAAGYGGRLAAAQVMARQYVGIDAGVLQVKGLTRLARRLQQSCPSATAEIRRAAAEDLMPHLESGSFDLIFSSPPYFHREKYGEEPEQSFRRYPSLQEWYQGFLAPVIKQSARLLRRDGFLVLNVNEGTEGIATVVREMARKDFRIETEWRMRLAKLPYKRSSSAEAYKWEPVIALQKRNRKGFLS